MENEDEIIEGYIKYFGPSTEDGTVDIGKAGKSLIALDKFLKRYQCVTSNEKDVQYSFKIKSVNKNCSELVISLIKTIVGSNACNLVSVGLLLKCTGIDQFGKNFFGTLGNQLALKIFSKGDNLKKNKEFIEKNKHLVELENKEGEKKVLNAEEWENYKKLEPHLAGFVQLEKGKEEEMRVGYKKGGKSMDIARIYYKEKDFFDSYESYSIEERMREPFDEENSKEEKIIGKFVDFYGMAHKYHFAFQARRNQDDIGKKKILCIVEEDKISKILDYLKPENNKNVCIFGRAARDWEDKVDKIKIEWFSEDENFNPNQTKII